MADKKNKKAQLTQKETCNSGACLKARCESSNDVYLQSPEGTRWHDRSC